MNKQTVVRKKLHEQLDHYLNQIESLGSGSIAAFPSFDLNEAKELPIDETHDVGTQYFRMLLNLQYLGFELMKPYIDAQAFIDGDLVQIEECFIDMLYTYKADLIQKGFLVE